jgi:hypothetical protein
MEAQAKSSQSPLESLAEKRPMDCKDAIDALSPEERTAILDALVELVKEGTVGEKKIRLLTNCLSFFSPEEVFEFFQRIRAGELLRQFCSFFNESPDFYSLIRMSYILLTNTKNDFLIEILMILNKKRYMRVSIGIQTLRFLAKNMTSRLTRETGELREKILDFLCSMGKENVRVILEIKSTELFDFNDWVIRTRKFIAQYKAQQQRSE